MLLVKIGTRNLLAIMSVAALAFVFACGTTETITKVERVEVPGETVIVEKEVVKTVEVPGQTVTKEVVKTVEVPGQTITTEVVKTVAGPERIVEKEVLVTRGGELSIGVLNVGPATGLPGKQTGGLEGIPQWYGVQQRLLERKADLSWQPLLLSSYEISADLLTLTGSVREGVAFHGGYGNLTAEDIKFSYGDAGLENPDSINGSVGYLHNYMNPLEAPSEGVVVIPLKMCSANPGCGVLNMVNMTSKKAYETLGADEALQNVIGTGPFEVTNWIADNKIEADTFLDYWNGAASFDRLTIREIPEASTRVAMIKTGEAGIIDGVPLSYLTDLISYGITPSTDNRGGSQQFISFGGNFWQTKYHDRDEAVPTRPGFLPDAEHPWIGDPSDAAHFEKAQRVRWALSQAIDRDLIVETVTEGQGRSEYIPYFSTQLREHQARWYIPYDLEKAKQELIDTGYGDGFEISMFVAPDFGVLNSEVFEAVATMWANIGLTPVLDRTAYQAFRPRLVQRQLDFLYAWLGGNELNDFNLPRGAAAEGSTWSEGDWNYGIEAIETYEAYAAVEANPTDRAAQVAANTKLADFYFDTAVGVAVVHSPNPVYYNPEIIARWTLLPNQSINSMETVVLK